MPRGVNKSLPSSRAKTNYAGKFVLQEVASIWSRNLKDVPAKERAELTARFPRPKAPSHLIIPPDVDHLVIWKDENTDQDNRMYLYNGWHQIGNVPPITGDNIQLSDHAIVSVLSAPRSLADPYVDWNGMFEARGNVRLRIDFAGQHAAAIGYNESTQQLEMGYLTYAKQRPALGELGFLDFDLANCPKAATSLHNSTWTKTPEAREAVIRRGKWTVLTSLNGKKATMATFPNAAEWRASNVSLQAANEWDRILDYEFALMCKMNEDGGTAYVNTLISPLSTSFVYGPGAGRLVNVKASGRGSQAKLLDPFRDLSLSGSSADAPEPPPVSHDASDTDLLSSEEMPQPRLVSEQIQTAAAAEFSHFLAQVQEKIPHAIELAQARGLNDTSLAGQMSAYIGLLHRMPAHFTQLFNTFDPSTGPGANASWAQRLTTFWMRKEDFLSALDTGDTIIEDMMLATICRLKLLAWAFPGLGPEERDNGFMLASQALQRIRRLADIQPPLSKVEMAQDTREATEPYAAWVRALEAASTGATDGEDGENTVLITPAAKSLTSPTPRFPPSTSSATPLHDADSAPAKVHFKPTRPRSGTGGSTKRASGQGQSERHASFFANLPVRTTATMRAAVREVLDEYPALRGSDQFKYIVYAKK